MSKRHDSASEIICSGSDGFRTGPQRVELAASVMCADICDLLPTVRELERAQVDYLHFDIMDGNFAPNIPIGLGMISQLRPHTRLRFDIHLMAVKNDLLLERLSEMLVDRVAIHLESTPSADLVKSLRRIRSRGWRAGVALECGTAIGNLGELGREIDYVILLLVPTGFSGAKMIDFAVERVRHCHEFLQVHHYPIPITVDGGISFENARPLVDAGASTLVCGSRSLFSRGLTIQQSTKLLRARLRAEV